jgi:glycosyltransferase involved in cell wall biosynthesis
MSASAGPAPAVAFVVFQAGSRADGGVESVTQLIERLRGFRVLVVTQAETPANERWRRAGAEVVVWRLPYVMGTSRAGRSWRDGRAARLGSTLATNLRCFRLLRARGIGVVHCNDVLALLHVGFGARAAGARVIFNVRAVKPAGERYGGRWRLAHRLAQATVVLSDEMRDDLVVRALPRRGAHPERIRVIRTGIDSTRLSPPDPARREALRRALGIGPDEYAVGYVGVLNQRKGQLAFAERALPALVRRLPAARVHFVGGPDPRDPGYADACRRAAAAAGPGAASFPGFAERVEEWYRALDVVALASQGEGLARCMIESLACGTPMVSFDVASAREVLEAHGCGLVVPQGDYAALAEALAALGEAPARRAALGRAGARAARELFDAERMVADYAALYRGAAAARPAAPAPEPAAAAGTARW